LKKFAKETKSGAHQRKQFKQENGQTKKNERVKHKAGLKAKNEGRRSK